MSINFSKERRSWDGRLIKPQEVNILQEIGKNIRFRRLLGNTPLLKLSIEAGISRSTLHKIECGVEGVSMSNYIRVFEALRIEHELLEVGSRIVIVRMQGTERTSIRKRASKFYY